MKYTPDGSLTYHVKHNSTALQLVLSEDVGWEQRILDKDRFDSIRCAMQKLFVQCSSLTPQSL
jgi:hypothetical protein